MIIPIDPISVDSVANKQSVKWVNSLQALPWPNMYEGFPCYIQL